MAVASAWGWSSRAHDSTRVAAFSVGVVPDEVSEQARAAGVRHYLAAGTWSRASGA